MSDETINLAASLTDDCAFPAVIPVSSDSYIHRGLTKRELFAAMAMQGLLSSLTISREEMCDFVCETSVRYADALLKQLEVEK